MKIESTDLYFTAFCLCRGRKLIEIIPTDSGRAVFVLDDANADLREWAEGLPMVNAKEFMHKLLWLKDQLFVILRRR